MSAKLNMKNPLLICLSLFVINPAYSQTPGWQWAINAGGSQYNEGHSIAIDSDENVYTTGRFSGVCDFDSGPGTYNLTSNGDEDIFILKVDSSGNFIWARAMGSAGIDDGLNIALDVSGNVIVTGVYRDVVDFDPGPGVFNLTSNGLTEIFILKLDSAGNLVWARSIGNSGYDNRAYHAVDLSGTNNIYVTGPFGNVVDFDPGAGVFNLTSAGDNDIYLLKLDSSGQFVWAKQIGNIDQQTSWDIKLNVADSVNIFITGTFIGTVDFDPSPATYYNMTSVGINSNTYVLKLDSAGNFRWVKAFLSSGNGNSVPRKMVLDTVNASNIYVTGTFNGTIDFNPENTSTYFITGQGGISDIYVVKLTNAGDFNWAFSLGSGSYEIANSITVDFSGDIHLIGEYQNTLDFNPGTGTYSLTSSGSSDTYIASYDTSGAFLWVKTGLNPNADHGYNIALSSLGNIYATGDFYNADLILDTISLPFTLSSGSNYFLAKLKGTGFPTALNNIAAETESILIYPNPATNELRFQSSGIEVQRVELFDLVGQLQRSEGNPQNNSIDISALQSGLYVIQAATRNGVITKKFIKQ